MLVIPGVAVATHVFDDVTDSETHAEGIEWVAASGVTSGCGGGNYCPTANVTRAQMGTFMCRLSGNCGVAPSVDADTVDGFGANDLIRFSGDSVDFKALTGVSGTAATATITAPGAGWLVVGASSDVYNFIGYDDLLCRILVDSSAVTASARIIEVDGTTGAGESECSTDAYYEVTSAGDYTVDFDYLLVGSDTTVDRTVLTVLFVPFDASGS